MSQELQQSAIDITSNALDKYTIEKDIASFIKREFDRIHGATWHVVVGKSFGSFVTHVAETNHFIYFYMGTSMAFLIFKSG
ncbi:hypothetical protein E3P99_01810 [Wallemia hederae]|uniref:Dynein light chain n=1 Tax=Wallemia hederae TaxID=1540922 RepID=A0A4T0FN27_9BASI|nr:hypothetical protein E3P99_01810 [Wallemia hederae]